MNKLSLAMMMLELHLSEWEPIRLGDGFAIRNRKTGVPIGIGSNLKDAILKARDYEIGKLNKKG